MTTEPKGSESRTCWFVGATYGTEDQTSRFINEGIWQNGYEDKYLAQVKSVQPGDRIAIKATYTQKNHLPFDNRGHHVAVMGIKAKGIVKRNHGDGQTLDVDWKRFNPPKEWYFFTYQRAIWRVIPGAWYADALISFTFESKPQDIDRFRNDPYWRERFGDTDNTAINKERFRWTNFYEAIADKLLNYRDRRNELINCIHEIASKVGLGSFEDHFQNGSKGPLKDICPFTAMGFFNRGSTGEN
ncbi:MAG: hypothetical protein ACR2PY_02320, partial [Salinispira sp.]